MNKEEYAVTLKHNGYNCAQAVLCAFAEECGLEEELLKKTGAAFCAGMGCMDATCGALCAAEILLGLKKYDGKPVLREAALIHREFTARCGASICRQLKGIDTGTVLCECDDCIRTAVRILSETVF